MWVIVIVVAWTWSWNGGGSGDGAQALRDDVADAFAGIETAGRDEAEWGGGRDEAVSNMVASLKTQALSTTDPVWRSILPLAADGLVAHARGRHGSAADSLGRVRRRLVMLGGSHTQRDLFEQIWLDSLCRATPSAALPAVREVQRARGGIAWARQLHGALAAPSSLALAS